MMCLIYGQDAVGKSIQTKAICEMSENSLYVSMEVKNRKLLGLDEKTGLMKPDAPFDVIEGLVLTPHPSYQTDYLQTYNKLGTIIQNVINGIGIDGKPKDYDTVVIDGISELDKMSEAAVLFELRKEKPGRKEIGQKDLASWELRNNLSCMPMEQLSNWAIAANAKVFLTTLLKGEYLDSVKKGYKVNVQDRIREKACEARVCLISNGMGHIARFEKMPGWAVDGEIEVAIGKGGLAAELMKRKLL